MTSLPERHLSLSPEDQRLLDALIEAEFCVEAMGALSEEERVRVDALLSLFGVLEDYPVEDASETLLDATLARIDRYEATQGARLKFSSSPPEEAPRRRFARIRLPDFISVAAMLLIAVSVAWPLMSAVKRQRVDTGCANNLRQVGYAFDQYALDYAGALPVATAGLGGPWYRVRNSTNLDPLVDMGYCEQGHLECGGLDHGHGPSYSYKWTPPGVAARWDTGGAMSIILGDRNPVIDALRAGRFLSPLTVSLNHGGRGQNVLRSDGSSMWLERPVVGKNDFIWWTASSGAKTGGSVKKSSRIDVFLVH